MAEYELNDQDRAELVIRFFKRYGSWMIIALVLFAVVMGFNAFWKNHEQKQAQVASNAYQALLGNIQAGAKPEVIEAAAAELNNHYSGTIYASLTELNLAQVAINQNNLASAETILQKTLAQNSGNALEPIISMRLARVLLLENKAEAVVKLLKHPPKGYVPAYGLLRGDADIELNHVEDAKVSYQEALAAATNNPLLAQLLTERLNNLSASKG